MILKSITMQGFKSCPDKTVLQFNKGITGVVGPNGSGKSNISDAVRWVLGEQSTKSLRGSKMEDVIFSGTSLRRATGFAEVTLCLDNSDRSLSIDKDEVSITRRFYRSGDSEYKINGDSVRLRDINELFMDTGLGRDGYSMVSQGKIAELISSKSGERREMFEEAAGISHFRYRRGDALKRLSQAEENLVRLRDILTELESRVGPLKLQSEKAQKFLVLAEERKRLEIGIWLNNIEKLQERLKEQDRKIDIASAQYESAQKQLSETEEKMNGILESTREINVRIEEVRNSSSHFEEQAAELLAQAKVYENSIAHNLESIERLEKDKALENESGTDIDAQITAAEEQKESAQKGLKAAEERLAAELEAIEKVRTENDEITNLSAELSKEISLLTMSLADNRVISETAGSQIDEIKARLDSLSEALGNRNETVKELTAKRTDAEIALNECIDKISGLKNAVEGYRIKVGTRTEKNEKLKSDIAVLDSDIQRKNERIRVLDDLEKNMEGYQGSVRSVMREKKRGALRGIHGPLSQLITVKDKYSVAVETALGAAIQNVVVDSENDAKRAIAFLKETHGGRATFLPLTAIRVRSLDEKGLDDCYGFVSIASKLVTADKKYGDIIENLLAKTVICDDMDSAVTMAKKYNNRFKIVTLDGQVINAGGSMTGGSKAHGVGMLSRGNEIERLKADVKTLEDKKQTLEAAQRALGAELAAAVADLNGIEGDILSANEEKIRLEGEYKLACEQYDTAQGAADELLTEEKILNGRIEKINTESFAAREKVEELTKSLAEKEKELENVSGDMESLAKNREELSQNAENIRLLILGYQKDAESADDNIRRLTVRKTSHSSRIEELDAEIEGFKNKNIWLSKDIESLNASAEELRSQSAGAKASVDDLLSQREQLEKESTDLRNLEKEKSSERERVSGELARLEERKAAMLNEFEDFNSKLYDEYQLTRREAAALEIVIENIGEARTRLASLKNEIRGLGSVNVSAIDEYKEVSERYEFMSEQIGDVEKSKAELLKLIDDLTTKMSIQFREQFQKINVSFGETFSELFGGGRAELVLEDEMNILECDIEIKVQPPGKNVQNINLLSGGEKGLSAIALLFAILKVTPAPFVIFDEVEAALDDVNVARYAQYVRRMTKNTQFILITHRRGTMEEADMLYGVTMQEEGVSKILELQTAEMARKLGLA
ncbi:MAG: chromosome segregation protein SMC [Oscillospiraceae bacterium]|nr:chromosome segregation protein SMC [Oscillospiraceae bacterium]